MKIILLLLLTSCASPSTYYLCYPALDNNYEEVAVSYGFVDHEQMLESTELSKAICKELPLGQVTNLDKRDR